MDMATWIREIVTRIGNIMLLEAVLLERSMGREGKDLCRIVIGG
jgi:hypothetical protein